MGTFIFDMQKTADANNIIKEMCIDKRLLISIRIH